MHNISLPRLDLIKPTLESTSLKLMEEAGELAQVVGKLQRKSNEPVAEHNELTKQQIAYMLAAETFDVAQTVASLAYILEEQYGLDLEEVRQDHMDKMVMKGYMSREAAQAEG